MPLISIIVALVVLFVLIWAVRYLAAAFALPQPLQAVITVLIVVIGVLYILSLLTGHGPAIQLR